MTDQDGAGNAPWPPPSSPGPTVPPYQAPGAPTTSYQPPGAPTPTYQPPGTPTAWGAPPAGPAAFGPGAGPYPQTTPIGGTAMPPPAAFPPMMPYGTPMPAYAPTVPTSGMAITAMVLSLIGFATCGVTSVVGLILSIVALRRIKASRGALTGEGLAIAGIVVGAVFTVLFGFIWLGSAFG